MAMTFISFGSLYLVVCLIIRGTQGQLSMFPNSKGIAASNSLLRPNASAQQEDVFNDYIMGGATDANMVIEFLETSTAALGTSTLGPSTSVPSTLGPQIGGNDANNYVNAFIDQTNSTIPLSTAPVVTLAPTAAIPPIIAPVSVTSTEQPKMTVREKFPAIFAKCGGKKASCFKSDLTMLGCDVEIFHVNERVPFYFFGLNFMHSNLTDEVCICPMPRIDPRCPKPVQKIARYMENLCYYFTSY